jgi:hypothetical protein
VRLLRILRVPQSLLVFYFELVTLAARVSLGQEDVVVVDVT